MTLCPLVQRKINAFEVESRFQDGHHTIPWFGCQEIRWLSGAWILRGYGTVTEWAARCADYPALDPQKIWRCRVPASAICTRWLKWCSFNLFARLTFLLY